MVVLVLQGCNPPKRKAPSWGLFLYPPVSVGSRVGGRYVHLQVLSLQPHALLLVLHHVAVASMELVGHPDRVVDPTGHEVEQGFHVGIWQLQVKIGRAHV